MQNYFSYLKIVLANNFEIWNFDYKVILIDQATSYELQKLIALLMLLLVAQMRIRETRKAIMSEPTVNLKTNNADDGAEWEFWENLREICLLPEQAAFNQSGKFLVTVQIICV